MATEQIQLVDGTIVRKCPTDKPLYCSRDGRFFSVHNMQITEEGCIMREVLPAYPPSSGIPKKNMHGRYPYMRHFGSRTCHSLVWETWVGPRTKGLQIDHINGNKMDWSLDNLEEVTPAENRKRAKILRVLRSIGRDPKQMSREELLSIFSKYTFTNPQNLD